MPFFSPPYKSDINIFVPLNSVGNGLDRSADITPTFKPIETVRTVPYIIFKNIKY